jgi:hypothetical protein
MSVLSAEDAGGLAADLVRMLKEREIDEAIERIQQARIDSARAQYDKRAKGVAELSGAIATLKRKRDELRGEIDAAPPDVQLDVEHRLWPLVQSVFNNEIARLRAQKRCLSKGR